MKQKPFRQKNSASSKYYYIFSAQILLIKYNFKFLNFVL